MGNNKPDTGQLIVERLRVSASQVSCLLIPGDLLELQIKVASERCHETYRANQRFFTMPLAPGSDLSLPATADRQAAPVRREVPTSPARCR